jgi:hypothetical protein
VAQVQEWHKRHKLSMQARVHRPQVSVVPVSPKDAVKGIASRSSIFRNFTRPLQHIGHSSDSLMRSHFYGDDLGSKLGHNNVQNHAKKSGLPRRKL